MPLDLIDPKQRVLIVAAHPDDEVIGMGGSLSGFRCLTIVSVSDGAPRKLFDWREVADLRRRELVAALCMAGVDESNLIRLEIPDQEVSNKLSWLSRRITTIVRQVRPDIVFTHPYEGGHPDHDACAFACHAAVELLAGSGTPVPVLAEFTSYHLKQGEIATGRFLPYPASEGQVVLLSEQQRIEKRRMMGCFASQSDVLRYFSVDVERFRTAPVYDFSRLPNSGALFYEQFDWGMTGSKFLGITEAVAAELLGRELAFQ
jgi:LmbE family N-acetylglucosaminyl deacetylase